MQGAPCSTRSFAEAYRDLEQATGRLALIQRLAALLTGTPDELLPTVCVPGQAPEPNKSVVDGTIDACNATRKSNRPSSPS